MSGASALLPTLDDQLALDEHALSELLDTLATARDAVAEADAALRSAQQVQHLLEARVAQQQRAVAAQRRFLCPMTKLPDDMIATIMRILHDDRSDCPTDGDWYFAATCEAFRCASVCQHWRALALSFPWLWNHIYVDMAVDSPATRNLIGLQFHRSAVLPLDIWIDCLEASPVADTFQDILGQSARWRTLRFIYNSLVDVFPYFRRPTPLLELFSLRNEPPPDHWQCPSCLPPAQAGEFLPYAPRLDTLELPPCTLHRLTFIPRPSLRRLELGDCDEWPQSLLSNLLASFPSLENADLHTLPPDDDAFPPYMANVTMSRLTELTIRLDLALSCLDALSLPVLQCLTVTGYSPRRVPETELLFQKHARIRKLSLRASHPADITPGRLHSVLEHLPKLESLYLSDFLLAQDDFAPLSRATQATGAWIVPKLKIFHVKEAYLDAAAASSCVSFVRSRTVDNRGSDSGRARLAEATCALSYNHPRGVLNSLDWLEDVLPTLCRDALA